VRNGPTPGDAVVELIGDGGFGSLIGTYLIESTTSDDAFDALLEKRTSVGLSARRIRPTEARALRAADAGNMVDVRQERIVAIDPLTVIVHPSNPIAIIRETDLAAIFSGQISNWNEIGGPDAPISVFSRAAGSATRDIFDERMMANATLSPSATSVEDNNQMAAAVNADPGAVGFVGFAFQRGAKPLSLALRCGILATPSAFASKTEEYPLDRRLYMYARADGLTPDAERFLDFATSSDADGAIAKAGFVDLGITRLEGPLPDDKTQSLRDGAIDQYERGFIETMVTERAKWDRLSSTFRFASGSSRLDPRGVADLARLGDYLADQPENTEIAIVGFTDNDGAFQGNMSLGLKRARQIAAELDGIAGPRLTGIKFQALGYGELAPAACNDTKDGKRINRRVEIWIRSPDASASTSG
jgi:phosphate transport system substrate-binding protein